MTEVTYEEQPREHYKREKYNFVDDNEVVRFTADCSPRTAKVVEQDLGLTAIKV